MQIVLDANALVQDFHRRSAAFATFFGNISRTEHEIVLPAVVMAEVASRYRHDLEETRRAVVAKFRKWSNLAGISLNLDLPSVDDLVAKYEETLRHLGRDSHVLKVGYPSVDHAELVGRALDRKAPFSASGSGYRDTLIWLSALDQLRSTTDTVVLVTRDKAFDEKKLAEELVGEGIDPHRLRVLPDINRCVEELIRPTLEHLTALLRTLNEQGATAFERFAFLRRVDLPPIGLDEASPDLGLPDLLEEPQVTVVEEVSQAELIDAWTVADKQSVVQVKIVAEVLVEGYVFKPDFWGSREDLGLEVMDSDFNRHYAAVSTTRNLALTLDILLRDADIQRFDVIDVGAVDQEVVSTS